MTNLKPIEKRILEEVMVRTLFRKVDSRADILKKLNTEYKHFSDEEYKAYINQTTENNRLAIIEIVSSIISSSDSKEIINILQPLYEKDYLFFNQMDLHIVNSTVVRYILTSGLENRLQKNIVNDKSIEEEASKIIDLIKKAKLKEGIQQLEGLIDLKFPEYKNEFVIHSYKFNDLLSKDRMGMVETDEKHLLESKIVYAILKLLEEITKSTTKEKKNDEQSIYDSKTIETIDLPPSGMLLNISPKYSPPQFIGLKLHKNTPFKFDFILDIGDENEINKKQIYEEAMTQIKYFFTSLIIDVKDIWVNLSPSEPDKIIPPEISTTKLGIDLLKQDYLLKQFNASILNPEEKAGSLFWKKVFKITYESLDTEATHVNTYNKMWIVPKKAKIIENQNIGFIVENELDVLLEEEYELLKNDDESKSKEENYLEIGNIGSKTMKEITLPYTKREVSYGRTFGNIRQIYNSLILSNWVKGILKGSQFIKLLRNDSYSHSFSTDYEPVTQIYNRYVDSMKMNVFDYLKEEYDENYKKVVVRHYRSGGFNGEKLNQVYSSTNSKKDDFQINEKINSNKLYWVKVELVNEKDDNQNGADTDNPIKPKNTAGIDFSFLNLETEKKDTSINFDFTSKEYQDFIAKKSNKLIPTIKEIKPLINL